MPHKHKHVRTSTQHLRLLPEVRQTLGVSSTIKQRIMRQVRRNIVHRDTLHQAPFSELLVILLLVVSQQARRQLNTYSILPHSTATSQQAKRASNTPEWTNQESKQADGTFSFWRRRGRTTRENARADRRQNNDAQTTMFSRGGRGLL